MASPQYWSVPREWDGESAFIVAGGPSVTQEMVDRLKGRKVLVINSSCEKAPWADYLFFGDNRWFTFNKQRVDTFAGRVVTCDNAKADKVLHLRRAPHPNLCTTPDGVMVRRTSLTGAINLLCHLGVKHIYVLGADGKKDAAGRTHHHAEHFWPQRPDCWDLQKRDLEGIVPSLKSLGVDVFNCNPDSYFRMFPFVDLEAALSPMKLHAAPDWMISVPIWGERCISAFEKFGLPSIRAALEHSKSRARFVIHTDSAPRLRSLMRGLEVEFRTLRASGSPHEMLGAAQRDAIRITRKGEALATLCADMVLSVECFAACEKQFSQGKRLVMNAATRTHGGVPPIGAKSRDLLTWTMQHKHPIIEQCFWGEGKSTVPWAVYFQRGHNIVLRAFHLHPFAAIKDREISFKGTTADFDLANSYSRDEVHVVTDADEMAMAEVSPLDRVFPNRTTPMTADSVADWAFHHAIDLHRWFFRENPIVIAGENDCGEVPISEAIIKAAVARGFAKRLVA